MAVAFAFMGQLRDFVLAPTRRMLPPGRDLIFTRPSEGFAVTLDIALIAGLVLAAPAIMYQVWLFVAPALYAHEKKFVVPFVLLTAGMRFMPRVEEVWELYVRMLVSMVLVFQIPTLAFFLAKLRVVTARFLWRSIKYAILIIFIVAAILTPSADPWHQFVFAAPMIGLYLVGIAVAWFAQPQRDQSNSGGLRLVFAAAIIDNAWRQHTFSRGSR